MNNYIKYVINQASDNIRRKGGWLGFAAFLMVMTTAFLPPLILCEILNIEPFTIMRLTPLLIWILYLLPGVKNLSNPIKLDDIARFVAWPLYIGK